MWILVDLHHILVRGRGWSSWLKELMLKTKDNKDTRLIGKLFIKCSKTTDENYCFLSYAMFPKL